MFSSNRCIRSKALPGTSALRDHTEHRVPGVVHFLPDALPLRIASIDRILLRSACIQTVMRTTAFEPNVVSVESRFLVEPDGGDGKWRQLLLSGGRLSGRSALELQIPCPAFSSSPSESSLG